jgi:hypothetical protein
MLKHRHGGHEVELPGKIVSGQKRVIVKYFDTRLPDLIEESVERPAIKIERLGHGYVKPKTLCGHWPHTPEPADIAE